MIKPQFSTCLWFNDEAEEAVNFYLSIFKDGEVTSVSHYGEAGKEFHQRPVGSVMMITFDMNGQSMSALNGGPIFKFNESISFVLACDDQEQIDYFWNHLSEGGDPKAQQCGWLKDRFGVSWQVVPRAMKEIMSDPDHVARDRAMNSMFQMKKFDIAKLKAAHRNK